MIIIKNILKKRLKNKQIILKKNIEKNITNIIASKIRTVEIEFHFIIRDEQIISLRIYLLESNKKGLIEEIKI